MREGKEKDKEDRVKSVKKLHISCETGDHKYPSQRITARLKRNVYGTVFNINT